MNVLHGFVGELSWSHRFTPNLGEIGPVIVLENNRWQLCGCNQLVSERAKPHFQSLTKDLMLLYECEVMAGKAPQRGKRECSGLKEHTTCPPPPRREPKCQDDHTKVSALGPTVPSKLGV